MKFFSLNNNSPVVSFKEAVINGLAPDKGLYFPNHIKPLPKSFFQNIATMGNHEIAMTAIKQFVSRDLSAQVINRIIFDVIDFSFPLVEIEKNVASLELFHGPTMAFKDVGARFMALCLGNLMEGENTKITVLVATSGDTGGAVAQGFLGVNGVDVVILYPSGGVSPIQEKQLTTLGQNITALEVHGTFDDCQSMVKTAFSDNDITRKIKLTSANSINVSRWLPQLFYFLFAYKQVQSKAKKIVFSVPSGNFGNVCAGMVAQKLGMPIKQFVASTNINDTVPNFMKTGKYCPKPAKATISNAMDVSNPSNFKRIRHLYNNNLEDLRKNLYSYSFTDDETSQAIHDVYLNSSYILDPHGAIGYLGLKKYQKTNPDTYGIFLETAHPVKFKDTVEKAINKDLVIPDKVKLILLKEKKSFKISNYEELKAFLLEN